MQISRLYLQLFPVVFCLAANLLVPVARAQSIPVDFYHPMDAQELIDDVTTANSRPFRVSVFVIAGEYKFDNLQDDQAEDDTASPLPVIRDTTAVFLPVQALMDFLGANPTGTQKALFRVENAQIFIGALLAPGVNSPSPSLDRAAGPETGPQAFPDGLDGGLQVEGFEFVVQAANSAVLVSGLAAECEEECVMTASSEVAVMDSYLDCGDNCAWFTDAGSFDREVSWEDIREAVRQSGLDTADITELVARLKRMELVLEDYDAAVIGSEVRAAEIAVFNGGSTAIESRLLVDNSTLQSRFSDGRALSLKDESEDHLVHNSVLSAPATGNEALDFVYGELTVRNSYLEGGEQGLEVTEGRVNLGHNSMALGPDNPDVACDKTFLADELHSLGYNIAPDDSCELDGPGDLPDTEPGLFLDGDSLVPQFMAGAPEIDGGAFEVAEGALPCSPSDMLGRARPQDADKDGTAQCDIGPVEMPNGPDIGGRQSGAFFDAGRDGEGIFVEMLGNGQALVYLFSYRPDGSPFWALGIGRVVANGIVIPAAEFRTTRGPSFGEDYDPDDVELLPFAELSVSFPNCANGGQKGVLAIAPNADMGFGPLLSRTKRLTLVLDCKDGSILGPGYSGSFFDPLHNGEGIIVQVISPTQAVAIWFTYDKDGNQYWVLGVGELDGNVLTVRDAYSQSGPSYGPGYDAKDVVRTTWGDFTMEFAGDCDSAELDYASVLAEFGSGHQDMVRLSHIDGLGC